MSGCFEQSTAYPARRILPWASGLLSCTVEELVVLARDQGRDAGVADDSDLLDAPSIYADGSLSSCLYERIRIGLPEVALFAP